MLKTAGVVAAAAAGLLMLGAPAFAGEGPGHGGGINNAKHGQVGLVNLNDIDIAKDINVNAVVGGCGNNVGVLGGAVPILSPSITGSCAAGGIVDGD
ncbi:hypothetical protein LWC34_38160 [Kibdelosporangium philippinense]|uniref:Small secreted domain n=1 Tax=Kibdelosporangium philippinense TaxID=211113 RepID=A0ABS8ZM05_9PSEU|nr:hypothetical protein [Kibdelosporangium philippinense]MCE7008597.1 hypothetical protein [Kibdelosporangium philippinense]